MLVQGAMLFPAKLKLVYQAARFAVDAHELDVARSLTEHGLKHAMEPETRIRFERLKGSLP